MRERNGTVAPILSGPGCLGDFLRGRSRAEYPAAEEEKDRAHDAESGPEVVEGDLFFHVKDGKGHENR